MKPSVWYRLDVMARQTLPVAVTLSFLLFSLVPLHIPGFDRIVPALPLMAIFHWSIYRPELMPISAVFLLGILSDALQGTPFGLHSAIYLGVYGAVTFQHGFFFDKSFAVVWVIFGFVAGAAMILTLLLVSFVSMSLVSPGAVFFQFLSTVAFFPVVAWLLSQLHRMALEAV